MEFNPFQAPNEDLSQQHLDARSGLRVEGKNLIVTDGTKLPAICITANQVVPEDHCIERKLTWSPTIVKLLIVISPIIFVIAYYWTKKQCRLTYGMSVAVRRRRWKIWFAKLAVSVLLFFGMMVPVSLANGETAENAFVIMSILFVISLVILFVGNSPLSVTKYQDGEFWISGFSVEYLARFASAT